MLIDFKLMFLKYLTPNDLYKSILQNYNSELMISIIYISQYNLNLQRMVCLFVIEYIIHHILIGNMFNIYMNY